MSARNTAASFWAQVDKSGDCWTWTGLRNRAGYGRLRWGGSRPLAHRVAYELEHGPVSAEVRVLHRCDNPPCVRPSHLFAGTQLDNIADMVSKGRQSTGGWRTGGDRNGMAKLTWEQARRIRSLYRPRVYSIRRLAREFGVSRDAIFAVVSGRTWRDAK